MALALTPMSHRRLVASSLEASDCVVSSSLSFCQSLPSYMLARAARIAPRRCLAVPASASLSTTASRSKKAATKSEDRINYNNNVSFSDIPDVEHVKYKRVTANDLEREHEPPRRVKMLVRDFIEDSLYNPNYGYFAKQATIFTALEPIDFSVLRNSSQFEVEVLKRYASYGEDGEGPGKQLWHTPTELFKVRHNRSRVGADR